MIRPSGPLPEILARSIFFSAAKVFAKGLAITLSPEPPLIFGGFTLTVGYLDFEVYSFGVYVETFEGD